MKELAECLEENKQRLHKDLPLGRSFDMVERTVRIGQTDAYLIGINGMHDTGILQRIIGLLQQQNRGRTTSPCQISQWVNTVVSSGQVQVCTDYSVILTQVLSGAIALFVDGFAAAVIMDLRQYPVRSISEPENEKVMRGSKDGFVETMLFNTNLIRRRIRSPALTFLLRQVGSQSKTDIAVAFIGSLADETLLQKVDEALASMTVSSLTLGSKSLEELLVKKHWWHPMPSMQKTERPDVACSYLMEGSILLIVDNSPSVLILPPSIFQFMQSPEDYYKNPITGNAFRTLRNLCTLFSLFLLPLLILLTGHYPAWTSQFALLSGQYANPLQVLLFVAAAEFGLDLMQYASAHTLSSLTTPLSIVGGLLISDIAVRMSWFSDEVIFYAAVTLLSTLVISNSEFADALRIYRMFLILATGFWGLAGFIGGTVLIAASVITTPTFAGSHYFWPLFPFNGRALKTVLFRIPTAKEQPENVWKRP